MKRGDDIMKHLTAQQRKQKGAHYTPHALSAFLGHQICDVVGDVAEVGPALRVLDPAVGNGELLHAWVDAMRLGTSCSIAVTGFDTDRVALERARCRFAAGGFERVSSMWRGESFLEFALSPDVSAFDCVIANPPYVRTQALGQSQARRVADQFGLKGRVDLYYAFLLGIANVLKPGGIAGVIVSNRLLSTQAGACVRSELLKQYDLLHVWDLGDTKLFGASVLPAVLMLRKKPKSGGVSAPSRFTSVYSCTSEAGTPVESVFDGIESSGCIVLPDGSAFYVKQGTLDTGVRAGDVWRLSNPETDAWLQCVDDHTALRFGDVGKIRVGVKTTADNVFIRSDWRALSVDEQPELLRPLMTHHMARRFRALSPSPQREILYPHCCDGGKRQAVDLSQYPRTRAYLKHHRMQLEGRQYIKKAGRQWYEIWVPQDPEAWQRPKLVFRDISKVPTFWMDLSGAIVNGDCYWMYAATPQQEPLLWIALGVANSRFIEMYYDARFNNRLYAGRRRFMTQYVAEFPLPDLGSKIAKAIGACSRALYEGLDNGENDLGLQAKLERLVFKAFGVAGE